MNADLWYPIATAAAAGGLLIASQHRNGSNRKSTLHGSARWATKKDLRRAGLLDNDGVYVGGWMKGNRLHYLRHDGPEHVLCYAPTRSGKGVSMVIPTLLSWRQSAVITDLKGELWALTAGWRQAHAGNKVLRFEPAAATGSCCFNPLDEIRLGTEHEVGDVQNLATLIVDPDGKGLRDHWQKTSQSLLVGCLLHLLYKAKCGGPPATLPALDAMLADPSRKVEQLWTEMNASAHPVVAAAGRDMIDRKAAPSEAAGIVSTAKSYLSLYRDPAVARNISRSDFRIADLMHHEDPVSLYVVTKPNDKSRLKPLVRVLVNQIVRLLASDMAFEGGRPKPTYRHRLLMMLDEFPSLGKLDIMQESLAFVAGYGIKCYLICQDINQLHEHYGKEESITSNCHVQCAFPPNRIETAEYLSRLTGETTVVKEEISRAGRGLSVTVTRSMKEHHRRLLTPDECMRLPGPLKSGDLITQAGDMVVYAAGFPAIRGRQPLYFQDPTFQARAAVPPPAKSDALLAGPTHAPVPVLALPPPATIDALHGSSPAPVPVPVLAADGIEEVPL